MMHVYRFHDQVAVNPPTGTGETFYLKAGEATKLGIALMQASSECLEKHFADSTVGTIAIEATGSRYD